MTEKIKQILIEEEMKESYVDYAMSVIMSRALPDVRDGLKPVHRRILFAMHELGLLHNKPFKKCARVVGDCLGKYHPHGDMAVYDALVRMAQDFSLRYTLVDGQGNFGCFTGNTKIKLLDGTSRSFKELCNIYNKDEIFYVYSLDKNGNIVVGEAKNPRLTRKNVELIEITLDAGEKIRCTPNHKFLLKSLRYKEAKDLTPKDSLMPGYFKLSPIRENTELKDYLMIKDNNTEKYIFVHDIIDKYNLNKKNYSFADGPVRHHIDFNKFNNNPKNIKRINWGEHTKIHNDHIKTLWKNSEFRKKQQEGIKLYYKNNPNHIEKLRKRIIEQNKDKNFIKKISKIRKEIWKNKELREKLSNKLKEHFNNNPEKRKIMSEFSKKMWSNPEKREYIINRLREVMCSDMIKIKLSRIQREKLAKCKEIIAKRSKKLKEFYKNNPEKRKSISERSKKLWKDEGYRTKFINEGYNHLSKIAKKAWQDPKYREIQVKKAKQLWEDDNFKNKFIASVKKSNLQRLKQDPAFMKKMAQKAALSHKINWKNLEYKNKVVRNKILYYINRLISSIGKEKINEENYNNYRTNNCFPKFDKAIKYFKDINEMISLAKEYNHQIISVKFLDYKEDVYDITINEHHNFLLDYGVFVHNSTDLPPASMRYTECKLSKISEELLTDIEKNTVKFIPNFDNTLKEPSVLPTKLPNLLINGSSGIAVGMATNIPPHNIFEIISAIKAAIENPNITISELMQFVKGPDFPTGAIIYGTEGIRSAYETGRGKILIRSKVELHDKKIIIKELPYQVSKSSLLENIADLVKEKTIEGISDIRDESDRTGTQILIELKQNTNPEVILNQLFKHTQLQITYGIIMLALVNNEPKVLNLKDLIVNFINHRKDVITKRTQFELEKAEKQAHILEGLKVVIQNTDEIIKLIKSSQNVEQASSSLISQYKLTEIQSKAILEMRLQRLTSLESQKLHDEHASLLKAIESYKSILASPEKVLQLIKEELTDLQKYSDKRRTEITIQSEEIVQEDLIKEENIVITITNSGYIKQTPLLLYKQQRRGGKGIIATTTKEEDIVENLFITSNLNYLLFFTNKGKVYWLKAYQVPEGTRYAKGKAIINLLNLEQNEKVTTVLPIKQFTENEFLIFATKKGIVKKTPLIEYSNPRLSGIKAITLRENDEVIQVKLTPGNLNIILATKNGLAIKFPENNLNSLSRTASGVRGIRLHQGDEVIGLEIGLDTSSLLTVTEKGYGKRTLISEYRLISRGGKGVTNLRLTDKTGPVVSIKAVLDTDEIVVITEFGSIIRIPCSNINVIGRVTQGVRLIRLNENDKVAKVARISNE